MINVKIYLAFSFRELEEEALSGSHERLADLRKYLSIVRDSDSRKEWKYVDLEKDFLTETI